jgi:hypothetical protein
MVSRASRSPTSEPSSVSGEDWTEETNEAEIQAVRPTGPRSRIWSELEAIESCFGFHDGLLPLEGV